MSTPKPSPSEIAILRANDEFYRAFSAGDYAAMVRVWAEQSPASCLHPGMPATLGREAVLQTWRQILSGSAPLEMRAHHAHVHLLGEVAIVTCYEGNGDRSPHLAATNVFAREGEAWRMVHHHAGPLARTLPKPPAGPPAGSGLN